MTPNADSVGRYSPHRTTLGRHLTDCHGSTANALDMAGTYMGLASLHHELHRRHDYGTAVHKLEDMWVDPDRLAPNGRKEAP